MQSDHPTPRQKLERHIPDFPGYRALNHLETDRLLRHHLQGELAEIRDRLAELIAVRNRRDEAPEDLSRTLRRLAAFREALELAGSPSPKPQGEVGQHDEERLFEFDLALLDKVAAFPALLDRLEGAVGRSEIEEATGRIRQGLAELEELNHKRNDLLTEIGAGN